MEKKTRGSRAVTLIIILVCVILAACIIWGVVSMLDKLTAYGNSTSINQNQQSSKDDEPEEKEDDPYETLPLNTYDPDRFTTENGLKRYESQDITGIPGIDVSSYQQEIDWQQVRDAGVEFAVIRLGYRGYSTGKLDLDDRFLENMEGAIDAGIGVGVYFFSQALTEEEAVEEAEFVLNWVRGYELSYPIVFDWEEVDAKARTDEMNMLLLTSCALAFCERIEQAGYTAAVYFNQAYGYQQLNLPSLKDHVFWLAAYEEAPTFHYDFQMWQYTNQGTVPGIGGPVDLNIYFQKK